VNIFFLNRSPVQAAEWHLDKHVIKMVTETAQLLSTAHRMLDGTLVLLPNHKLPGKFKKHWMLPGEHLPLNDSPEECKKLFCYRATHPNVPLNVWLRSSAANYRWLYQLFLALLHEFSYRYNKSHSCEKLVTFLSNIPKNIKDGVEFVDPPAAMPDKYKVPGDVQESYKRFYVGEKHRFATWKVRSKPEWYDEYRKQLEEELLCSGSKEQLTSQSQL
jgi:hypothetical protein